MTYEDPSQRKLGRKLDEIAKALRAGQASPAASVRDLLGWYDAERRGELIVADIRRALRRAGLKVRPNFVAIPIDGDIAFELLVPKRIASDDSKNGQETEGSGPDQQTESPNRGSDEQTEPESPSSSGQTKGISDQHTSSRNPAYIIGPLQEANRRPVTVPPDCTLFEAASLMKMKGISHLPVMPGNNDVTVKGIVILAEIGEKFALKNAPNADQIYVRDVMNKVVVEIASDASLTEGIIKIRSAGYVLVRDMDDRNRIKGIVTSSDIATFTLTAAEPFLLLEDIESGIRDLIRTSFRLSDVNEILSKLSKGDSKNYKRFDDLSFGEYISIIDHQDRWPNFAQAIDRKVFCREMKEVRDIRNDVMHFDPDQDITKIAILRKFRDCVNFLRRTKPPRKAEVD